MKTIFCLLLLFTSTVLLGQNSDLVNLTLMPTSRMAPKGVRFGNEIFVMGGVNNGAVEIYNPSTNTWRIGKNFNSGDCLWVGVDSSDEKIYALITMGTEGHIRYLLLSEYNPIQDTWRRIDSLNYNITSPSFTIHNNKCYITGGFTIASGTGRSGNIDSLFIYDLTENKWSRGLNIPDERHAASIFSVDTLIYVFNGVGNCFCTTDILKVNIYNTNINQWITVPGPSQHIAYTSGSLFNNKINFFGSNNNQGISFNLTNGKWEVNNLPRLRNIIHYCEVVYNNKVYIFGGMKIGGSTDGQYSNSAFYYDPSATTDIKFNENKKSYFRLEPNYPNPLNSETVFSYQLSSSGHVEIKIFNALGQEIATLLDREQMSGEYKIRFDAGSLSSGNYLYSINVGGLVKTNKMIIMK